MDVRLEIREFLASRRARLTPDVVGMPARGGSRRVPGLRREEVAVLAGISAPYYARLERGELVNASPEVVDAVVTALRLDDSERSYLTDQASWNRRRFRTVERPSDPAIDRAPPRMQLVNLLRTMTGAAGFICSDRGDVLVANPLGRAVAAPVFASVFASGPNVNVARYVFLDPQAPVFFGDSWSAAAAEATTTLRRAMGRHPDDPRLTVLIAELSSGSERFRRLWRTRDVAQQISERRRYVHPVAGLLELNFERLALPLDPRLTLLTLSAAPGSRSAEALAALGD